MHVDTTDSIRVLVVARRPLACGGFLAFRALCVRGNTLVAVRALNGARPIRRRVVDLRYRCALERHIRQPSCGDLRPARTHVGQVIVAVHTSVPGTNTWLSRPWLWFTNQNIYLILHSGHLHCPLHLILLCIAFCVSLTALPLSSIGIDGHVGLFLSKRDGFSTL